MRWPSMRLVANAFPGLVDALGGPVRLEPRVGQPRHERVHVVPKRNSGDESSVMSDATSCQGVRGQCFYDEGPRDGGALEVDGVAFFQAFIYLGDGVVRVTVEYVKVADAVIAEERAGRESLDGAREIGTQSVGLNDGLSHIPCMGMSWEKRLGESIRESSPCELHQSGGGSPSG
jgi:hypothetical protein